MSYVSPSSFFRKVPLEDESLSLAPAGSVAPADPSSRTSEPTCIFSHETTATPSGTVQRAQLIKLGAWLRSVSREDRHFTVGGGRLRQSGPRPEGRLLRQPALEGLTRSARTETPRKVGRNKFQRVRRGGLGEE
ncbi:hypothetical protein F511_17987 [Dorcoceras hygrometricum]|uniref:Uncharacterized protein n=1 Tax=Dorcoceras hygrometricum TaxID=472368 RepID=A0A2Z7C3R4_9LAMI|nr:hypothetical protein F511_17987 [Dorcoceras hygrometricum]